MLPVSAWPPGSPGAALSPFGRPRQVGICGNGFVIPKGAWIVATASNQVVMFYPPALNSNPARTPGTGLLSGSVPAGCPPKRFLPWNQAQEDFREWQRATGDTSPPLRSSVGRRPPNWFGWDYVPALSSTLVPAASSGLVLADGQNVVITGSGCATITQAYSV